MRKERSASQELDWPPTLSSKVWLLENGEEGREVEAEVDVDDSEVQASHLTPSESVLE